MADNEVGAALTGMTPEQIAGFRANATNMSIQPPTPPNLLQQAQEQYPVLKNYDYGYKENFKPDMGFLEHWEAGKQEAAPGNYRPQELSMDRPGVEVYDRNTRPIDILGDITSHHLVNADPVVKKAYEDLQSSMSPRQHAILQDQYQYAQRNEGETRPYEEWRSQTGMPGFFRGYTFQQWPKEFTDQAYSPEQRAHLDRLMNYLSGKMR